jgi:hypothetical protein
MPNVKAQISSEVQMRKLKLQAKPNSIHPIVSKYILDFALWH